MWCFTISIACFTSSSRECCRRPAATLSSDARREYSLKAGGNIWLNVYSGATHDGLHHACGAKWLEDKTVGAVCERFMYIACSGIGANSDDRKLGGIFPNG